MLNLYCANCKAPNEVKTFDVFLTGVETDDKGEATIGIGWQCPVCEHNMTVHGTGSVIDAGF